MRSGRRVLVSARARAALAATATVSVVATVSVAGIGACTGDDESFLPARVYSYDAATFDRAAPPAATADAAAPGLSCGDAGGAPPRALVVATDVAELAAVNLDTLAVDGRYRFADGGSGVTSAANGDPWVVDPVRDTVTRLDAHEPWKPLATWDVHGDDGAGPSAPALVVQVSCTKAYVLRAGRDRIAIIDPSEAGGVAKGFVDLGRYRAAGDTGTLDLASAVFVPAKKKVFVLAGNVDRSATAPAALLCRDRKPTIFAIDIATDDVVSLAGKGPGGSIELTGYAPPPGSALTYDAPLDRLLVSSQGCVETPAAAATKRRIIEKVDLATSAVSTVLSLLDAPAPTGLALIDADHAIVLFGDEARRWNPQEAVLGPKLEGLERVTPDGRGGALGARRGSDGGVDLVHVPIEPDGGAVTLVTTIPFSAPASGAASLEIWPHR